MAHDITLDELVHCTKQGYMLVAESAIDGSPVYIGDTVSGLACNCVCPGCGRQMVARKGDINAHTFAHYGAEDGIDCRSAGETALHKFAKDLLAKELKLRLPPVIVEDHNGPLFVTKEMVSEFDSAVLEERDGDVVPDVVCLHRERRLHVEFKVTHPCDDVKIAKLAAMGVGSIEIDLSEYRYVPLKNLRHLIIHKAKRRWLHTRKFEEGLLKLDQRARAIDSEKNDWAQKLARIFKEMPRKSQDDPIGPNERKAIAYGLKDLLKAETDGTCFTVRQQEWQAFVLMEAHKRELPFEADSLFRRLASKGWIHKPFENIGPNIATRVEAIAPNFVDPRKAYSDYLTQLMRYGFLIREGSKYAKSELLQEIISKAEASFGLPEARSAELEKQVDMLMRFAGPGARTKFDFDRWLANFSRSRGLSSEQFLRAGDDVWDEIVKEFVLLYNALTSRPTKCDTLGLPLGEILANRIKVDRERQAQRHEILEAMEKRKADDRVANVVSIASTEFGLKGEEWVATPKHFLNGETPIVASRKSPQGYELVREALFRMIHTRNEEAVKERIRDEALDQLRAAARRVLPSSEHVDLWMRQTFKNIDGLKPIEYCVDSNTLAKCIQLLNERDGAAR